MSMKKIYNVTILGGTNWFWKWLAEYIQEHFNNYITLRVTGSKDDNIEAVKWADIVIYSLPISITEGVIKETLPYIQSDAVVCDVTSIKKIPSFAMQARDDIIVIPTHPMFWPYISSIAGQVFVLTPEEKVQETEEYKFLKHYLQSQKARVIESTPEYHDRMMAVVQGLTHLNMFVVGETMRRLRFNIKESMDFISPIYKLMVSSVGRYLGQNPGLYADIQMYNDEVLEVHEKFLDTAKDFHTSVSEKNSGKFCQDIIDAREYLWVENCEEWQEYTDKVIYLLGKQIDILKQNIWKEIVLRNIYSSEEIRWMLEWYTWGKIFLKGGKIYTIDQYDITIDRN